MRGETHRYTMMNIQFQTSDLSALHRAIEAGCKWVRWMPEGNTKDQVAEALEVCRQHEAVMIVDDDASLCLELKADGVHLHDAAQAGTVRRELGEEPLIGVTVANFDEARTARAGGADYLEMETQESLDHKQLRQMVLDLYEADFPLPLSVAGSVTPNDIPTISGTGARGIATSDEAFFKKDIWALIDKLA